MRDDRLTLAVLGGSGALGHGLALRWLKAGYHLVIGSRSAEKASAAAALLRRETGVDHVEGRENGAAAAAGHMIVLTVPFAAQRAVLESIRSKVQGKIVVDATVALRPPAVGTVSLPPEGSAAQVAQRILGENVAVVSAFHNVAAAKLQRNESIDCDVLVCGDEKADRDSVIVLVEAAGLRGVHAGPLANSAAAEAMTSVLISINKRYQVDGSGIRITGNLRT